MESIKHFTGRRNPVGPDSDRKRTPMRNFQRRGAAIAAFAFAFAAAPVIGLGAPAISRADDHNCMSGWTWDNVAQQCVISPVPATTAPAQNGPPPPGTPGGVYGPGGWGGPGDRVTSRPRRTVWTVWAPSWRARNPGVARRNRRTHRRRRARRDGRDRRNGWDGTTLVVPAPPPPKPESPRRADCRATAALRGRRQHARCCGPKAVATVAERGRVGAAGCCDACRAPWWCARCCTAH